MPYLNQGSPITQVGAAQANSQVAPSSVYQELYDQAAPGIAASQAQMTNYANQANISQAQTQAQADQTQQQAGYQLSNLGLASEDIASQQQGALASQALQQQQYGLQQAGNTLTGQQINQNYATAQQGLQGGLAASGALNTAGSKQQQGTLFQQALQNQQRLGLTEQGEAAQNTYDIGAQVRQQQQLQRAAQANGLSVDELLSRTDYGLNQLGLNQQQNASQLYSQYATAQAGEVGQIGQVIGSAALAGGINPNSILAGG